MFVWLSNRKIAKTSEYNLVLKWEDSNIRLKNILEQITVNVQSLKLVRFDDSLDSKHAVMLIVPNENSTILISFDNPTLLYRGDV